MWKQFLKQFFRKPKQCTICYEQKVSVKLSCEHSFCETCLKKWFVTLNGPECLTCPDCRTQVTTEEAVERLGQDFVDSLLQKQNDPPQLSDTEMDQLTAQYMVQQELKQCTNCGAWIELVDGCHAIVCLCGNRFCWQCSPNDCECGHSSHDYFNNILGRETALLDETVATLDDFQDLKAFWQNYQAQYEQAFEEHGGDY